MPTDQAAAGVCGWKPAGAGDAATAAAAVWTLRCHATSVGLSPRFKRSPPAGRGSAAAAGLARSRGASRASASGSAISGDVTPKKRSACAVCTWCECVCV